MSGPSKKKKNKKTRILILALGMELRKWIAPLLEFRMKR